MGKGGLSTVVTIVNTVKMPPRIDSPTNFADTPDEVVAIEAGSLASRPLRRVPTPMKHSHPEDHHGATDRDGSLFDDAEKSSRRRHAKPSAGGFFAAELESLAAFKSKANEVRKGKLSLHEMIYGSPSAATPKASERSPRSKRDADERTNLSARDMMEAIAQPFVACSANFPDELDAMGDLVAQAVLDKHEDDDLSRKYSDDSDDNKQIRRMTSWNTLETAGTAVSYLMEGADTSIKTIFDDDGNPIPSVLVDLTKEMRQKRSRRKRVVKFDYPPISSLKECPRPDPDDLPNLYFTEDELNQIEDDRISTTTADDVEVVCVSSSESSDKHVPYESRPLREAGGIDESDTSSLLHGSNGTTAAQKQRRYQGRSPAPKKRFGRNAQLPPKHPHTMPTEPEPSVEPTDEPESLDDGNGKRLIKSVHIFMRERSRERSAEI
jgi:hypothetical protein